MPERTVVLVGLVGLSAVGKTTAAHSLARHLCSPLHPISLDDYYIPAECERLGTFEDYRGIDLERFVREMQQLKRLLARTGGGDGDGEERGREGWRRPLQRELPSLFRYVVVSVPAADDARVAGRHEEATPAGSPSRDGLGDNEAESGDAGDDDSSLVAHAMEEERLRARSSALARSQAALVTAGGGGGSGGRGAVLQREEGEREVLFLVCEGFCLFSSEAVARADLFDVCVWVRCPLEIACRRRFQRTPRRHKPSSPLEKREDPYRSRIERMWCSRTEQRRVELQETLARGLGLADSEAPTTEPALRLVACGASSPFFPPRQVSALSVEGEEPLWEPALGEPTDAFAGLLQQLELAHAAAVEEDEEEEEGKGKGKGEAQGCGAPPPVKDPDGASPLVPPPQGTDTDGEHQKRYLSFRYWFFFEVAYYYCFLLPLQRHHVRRCFGVRGDGDDAANAVHGRRLVLTLDSGDGVAATEAKVVRLASAIAQHWGVPPQ